MPHQSVAGRAPQIKKAQPSTSKEGMRASYDISNNDGSGKVRARRAGFIDSDFVPFRKNLRQAIKATNPPARLPRPDKVQALSALAETAPGCPSD